MKANIISILQALILIILLNACSENNPNEVEYSNSRENKGIKLFVKNGTATSDGELKLVNNSNKKIFIEYIIYPYCSFSFYDIEKQNKIYFNWESLLFIEAENKWRERNEQDTLICYESRPQFELNHSENIVKKISGLIKGEEYRIMIIFKFEPSIRGTLYTIGCEYVVE